MSIENMNEQKERAKPVGKEKTPLPQGAIEVDKKTFEKFVENGLLKVSTAMARYSLVLTDFGLDSIHPEESLADIKIVDPNLNFTPNQIKKDEQALALAGALTLAKAKLVQKEASLSKNEKKTLVELTGKVLSGVGKALASTGGKKALVGATTLSLIVSSCNFPQTYEPPSPTTPQTVETAEIPTFTPTTEFTATLEPTPTLEPTATPTLTAEEAEKAAKEKIISDLFEHGVEAVAGVSLNSASETKDFMGEDEMYRSLGNLKNMIDALVNNKIYSIEIPAFAEPLLASYRDRQNVNLKLREGEGGGVKPAPEGFWRIETKGFQDKSLGIFARNDQSLWQAVFPKGKTALSEWTMAPQASTDFITLPQQNTYGELVWVKPAEDAPWTAVQIDSAGRVTAILNKEVNIIDTQRLWTLAEGVERVKAPEEEGPNYFEKKIEKATGLFVEMKSPRTDYAFEVYLDDVWGKWALDRKDDEKTTDFFLKIIHKRMQTTGDFRGDWEEFTRYLADGGKLILSDTSAHNLRTGEVDYFDKMEIQKSVVVYTDYSTENQPPFKPRYSMNIGADSKFDLAYDPEKPGVIYHYMSVHNLEGRLRSSHARENLTNQLFLRPSQMLLFTDKQWEDYGRTEGHDFRSIGEKGLPLMNWMFLDLYLNHFTFSNYTNNNFRIYRVR